MLNLFKNLWFQDVNQSPVYINDVAVRIRAGILIMIPLFMGLTLFDAVYGSKWIVDANTAHDTYETDWDEHIIYAVEAIKKPRDYTLQTGLLLFALFEMLAGMFVFSSRFSPTIWVSTLLARSSPPVWKPLVPKRFAWVIGASLISTCLVFFNPDTFAGWINAVTGSEVLPTTYNYLPYWVPLTLVWVCLGFMWLESVLGLCIGCKIHALLVWMGIFKESCEACNNLDWDKIAANKAVEARGSAK